MTKTVSVKMPVKVLRRIPSENVSDFIRQAVTEKLLRLDKPEWTPKTAHGKRLLALSRKFEKAGGKLLEAGEIADEIRQRRGGLA